MWPVERQAGDLSVQFDGTVEVPRPADFDHVELASTFRLEGLVGPLTFHDAP
jgi:hypothetical protein